MSRPKEARIGRSKLRFRRDLGDRTPGLLVTGECRGVHRNTRDLCFAGRERDPLVELEQVREWRDRVSWAALDLRRSGCVAQDERMWDRAMHEPERHARVHRVDERALAFDEAEPPASSRPLGDETFGRAGEKVR